MIRLVPMTAAQFNDYLGPAIADYAEAHRKAGDAQAQEALELAKADYDSLLPLGIETPNHHLFTIVDAATSQTVGMIWYEARERRGRKSIYIFDFQVDAPQRGKGYGTAALQEVERMARLQGIGRINLNVMGWNHRAQALYESVGFSVAGIGMTKVLA